MGIREYFQENPPGEKDLNIHDIVIEKEEKEDSPFFDPEREITDQYWQEMVDRLNQFREKNHWSSFNSQAASMIILFPERRDQLNLNEESWEGITKLTKNYLDEYYGDTAKTGYFALGLETAAHLKILFPNKEFDITFGDPINDGKLWRTISNELEKSYKDDSMFMFVEIAAQVRLLFPEKFSELEILKRPEVLSWVKEKWMAKKHEPVSCIGLWSDMRFAFPEIYGDAKLSKESRNVLREELFGSCHQQTLENEFSCVFSNMAIYMKIVDAKIAEITDRGTINIVMPSRGDFKKPKTPRPERRQF